MYDFAEAYALVFNGEIKGYRFYTYKGYKEYIFDIQADDTSFSSWCSGRIPLKRLGNLLVTEDEINGTCKPTQLQSSNKDKIKELIEITKHYRRLETEETSTFMRWF